MTIQHHRPEDQVLHHALADKPRSPSPGNSAQISEGPVVQRASTEKPRPPALQVGIDNVLDGPSPTAATLGPPQP